MRTAASTCVLCTGVHSGLGTGLGRAGVAVVLAALAALAGCTASAADTGPPSDQLFFPTGLAVAPDDSVLFVANSNSELRYDSGTINVIDLDMVQQAIHGSAPKPGDCSPDPDHRESLICDEAQFILLDAGVRIGNFATTIAVQDFGPGNYRVFVPTRGDPSIAWANYDGNSKSLSCTADAGHFQQCDDAHRLTSELEDPDMTHAVDEPFDVFASASPDGSGFAVVTHQTNGVVTLVDSPATDLARITDIKYDIFDPDLLTGLRGATGVSGRSTPSGEQVYVGSRTEDRIQMFTVGRPEAPTPAYLVESNFFFLNAVGTDAGVGGSTDTRGMTFSQDGNQLYLVNRMPPSVQVYDTTLGADGFPVNRAIGASDICRDASTLTALHFPMVPNTPVPVAYDRIYLTCFDDGQVYVVDPSGVSQVEDVILVGRGPYAVAAAPTRNLVFVTNFLEDTIAVIDVDPMSVNRNRVVLRIGTPKAPES
ncbi:MAG TPA: hypothetical protein VH165_02920 [Kofleriaceae bacterium]|nr:hypothetical protein [Kofleriaceae bacterium]